MILTVDIGNSNICFAIHADDTPEPVFFERIHTNHYKTALEYMVEIRTIFELHHVSFSTITDCALSSVVPVVTPGIEEALQSLLSCRVLRITPFIHLPYGANVEDISPVGADILCDNAGTLLQYGCPAMTFDLGTATVASSLDARGNLDGVLITAGVRTSLNSLVTRTASLPQITLDPPPSVLGESTAEAMQSGIIYGTAGLIDGIIDRTEEETGLSYTVVATGGLSRFIAPYCRHEIILDPTLLMKGMWNLLRIN